MDLAFPTSADAFRSRIRTFLDDNLPADWAGIGALEGEDRVTFLDSWRETLADNGLLAVNWPAEWGGAGLSALENVILHQEFAERGAPTGGTNDAFGISMLGNTILAMGTDEQKAHFIPRILSGEDRWCQGYSEPGAGSDLAGLGCKAVLDGDEWVIDGQKIWTSSGQYANWIFVLARTAPDEVKHRGITFLLVPMDQPGVELRPIKNIAGHEHFNEVFFTEARCPKDHVIGEVHGGWAVANALLGFERGAGATVTPMRYAAEFDRFRALAVERGLTDDPLVRQTLADAHIKSELLRFAGLRALTRYLKGQSPGPESSIFKLSWSTYHSEVTEAMMNVIGAESVVDAGETTVSGLGAADMGVPNNPASLAASFMVARSGTIYAGTSQVQKNIIGERVLGLPKEPRTDAGPWKDIPKG
ncbi:MAG: acyl-CoA dehydrogenase family protein [Acidimicrobiales bacterium]